MEQNFEYFGSYVFDEKFYIDDRLYTIFQEKEKNI